MDDTGKTDLRIWGLSLGGREMGRSGKITERDGKENTGTESVDK